MNRRRVLLILGSVALPGCTGTSGPPSPRPTSAAATTSAPPTSTATTTAPNYLGDFQRRLTANSIMVQAITVGENRAELTYNLAAPSTAGILDGVETVSAVFKRSVAAGWVIEGLDVTVTRADGRTIASYRIESIWALQAHEGTITTAAYAEKIGGTVSVRTDAVETTTSSTPTTTARPPPSSITLGGKDTYPREAFTRIRAEFAHETAWTIDPASGERYSAAAGRKWLAVQLRIRNQGDGALTFEPAVINFRTDGGGQYAPVSLEGATSPLSGADLAAHGGTTAGWLAFEVPTRVEAGNLVVDQSVYENPLACEFARESDLVVRL